MKNLSFLSAKGCVSVWLRYAQYTKHGSNPIYRAYLIQNALYTTIICCANKTFNTNGLQVTRFFIYASNRYQNTRVFARNIHIRYKIQYSNASIISMSSSASLCVYMSVTFPFACPTMRLTAVVLRDRRSHWEMNE